MHESKRGAAFYVETILLVLFLLFSLTVLVRMLGTAKQLSGEARRLSCAVRIAQDAAEQLAASDSREEFARLLGARQAEDGTLIKEYDAQGAAVGDAAAAGENTADETQGAAAGDAAAANESAAGEMQGAAVGNAAAANESAAGEMQEATVGNAAAAGENTAGEDAAQNRSAAESGTQAAYSLLCRVETVPQGPGVMMTAHFTVSNHNGVLYELETQKYLRK